MDRKFAIAVLLILILACALAYVALIKPKVQGYVINKQVEAQGIVVKAIMNQVNAQGYVQLFDGNNSIILVKYVPPADQQQPAQ